MDFTEKIDVLDFIINILNEHEKKLDNLTKRLEVVACILTQAKAEEELKE